MPNKLPPFEPVTLAELRRIYAENRDPDIRRLALEVARYRALMSEIDGLYKALNQTWLDTVGGSTFALQQLKVLMGNERFRTP